MKPLTIRQLLIKCQEEINKGHGDYNIMLSDDDEGNGYHYLWYSFITPTDLVKGCEDDYIYGLDEDIAPRDKTILLG